MVVAVVGARGDLACITVPSLSTIASAVGAISVTIASFRALNQGTVKSGESRVALTCPVHTDSTVGAVIGASLQGAVLANKSRLTEASGIVAIPIARAIVGT